MLVQLYFFTVYRLWFFIVSAKAVSKEIIVTEEKALTGNTGLLI